MFSGIIRNLGQVSGIKKNKNIVLEILTPELARISKLGDSVAVYGVCLTVVKRDAKKICFELIPQTWKVTRLSQLKVKDKVNLEKSLKLKDYIDGHLLMGHVDGVAMVKSIINDKNLRAMEFTPPLDLQRFIALRGGISINGVSLTVSHLSEKTFSVSLTDYTLKHTNLGGLKVGGKVNLEVDMVGRYLDNLLKYQSKAKDFIK
ncbi:riboflavin synthase [Candidatus Uhrbacteria bacterium]|nr:riboflavin synthase [Candidatus Uhrbacteria bacterium]